MRLKHKLVLAIGLALIVLGAVAFPVLARPVEDWWNPIVDVKVPLKLEPYKGSYWASILFPGYVDCQSASLLVGTALYTGTIKQHWWWFRSCEVTFSDVPANTTGLVTVNYWANGNWSHQKTIKIGKTWRDTIYTPKMFLPWIEY